MVEAGGSVTVVGEVLMDFVPARDGNLFEAMPGGSPANVAVGLARLGVPAGMAARLAEDAVGRRLRRHLTTNGVDVTGVVQASEPSSIAIVSVGADGSVEYDFRIDGAADWQWQAADAARVLRPDVACIHFGSLAMTMPPGADVLCALAESARDATTVSYDPNCRPLVMGDVDAARARVEAVVCLADVVKTSHEDIAWLYPGVSAEEIVESWLGRGPSVVAVTLGPEGVVAGSHASGLVGRTGRTVEVVDTVGAGDAFTSAMLAALRRLDLLGVDRRPQLERLGAELLGEVLDEAVLASAITCTRHGADPPTTAELADARAL